MSGQELLTSETYHAEDPGENARRRGTTRDIDPTKWQTFCCPHCGTRLRTVFVGLE